MLASYAANTHPVRAHLPHAGHETPPRRRLLSKTLRVDGKLSIVEIMKIISWEDFDAFAPLSVVHYVDYLSV
ncbi:hypothetical protein ACRQ1B_19355 [Rhizobium panacihumi]|uniref:hypothetical protein n=1 Tax=Rhizobium panacihumi TaxID=2008450 RepID=UPI003D79A0E4